MDLQGSISNLQGNNVTSPSVTSLNAVDINPKQQNNSNSSSSSIGSTDSSSSVSSSSVVTQLVSGTQAAAAVYSSLVNQSDSVIDNSSNANSSALNSARSNEQELAEAELEIVQQLATRDREVRAHEQAHASIGGVYAGSPVYEYESGPDGQLYATSGHVSIDTSPVENDPRATLEKAQVIIRAALSVSEPSTADRQVASEAKSLALQAIAELSLSTQQPVEGEQTTSIADETARVEEEKLKSAEFREEEELKEIRSDKEQELTESREQRTEASVEVLKEFNVQMHEIQETLRRLNNQLVDTGALAKVFPEGALIDRSV